MQTEVFTPDDLSSEALHALFDAAMFDTKLDEDGDLFVRDRYRVFVTLSSKKSLICFRCVFGVKESAGIEAGIALCNRINDKLIVVRASMHDPTTLIVDWYLPVAGGIGKKAVVLAFRKFNELAGSMGKYDTDDIMK